MKIGLMGNQNNSFFSLARYLHDKAFEADVLLYENEDRHFLPLNDTFLPSLPNYVRQTNWGDPGNFTRWSKKEVRKDLESYDVLIGCGAAPAIANWIGRQLQLFIPYGYDLYNLPRPILVHPKRQLSYLLNAFHQLRGIRKTPFLMFDKVNDEYESVIRRLKYTGTRVFSTSPFLYLPQYEENNLLKNTSTDSVHLKLKKLRQDNDFLFCHPVRHEWLPKKNLKSNDKLLKGYKMFLESCKDVRSNLILFEYGRDVNASKKLIEELGIGHRVVWFPTLSRKHVMLIIYYSDLVIGELYRSWLTYGGACEAMAMRKPLMHYRNDSEFKDTYPELYPMINAYNNEMICHGLKSVANQPEKFKIVGQKAHDWFVRYCIDEPLNTIISIIKSSQNNQISSWSE